MAGFATVDLASATLSVRYNLLTSLIQPRPIALVSSLSPEGVENLAPFSFFMVGGANPASLMISPVLGANARRKDTLRNIEATGEFVINLVHRQLLEDMNAASKSLPPTESEWSLGSLTRLPSRYVAPPRVAESEAQFECKLHRVVEHGEGESSACYVIAEAVCAHVLEHSWDESGAVSFKSVSRLGGSAYLDEAAMEILELKRPG